MNLKEFNTLKKGDCVITHEDRVGEIVGFSACENLAIAKVYDDFRGNYYFIYLTKDKIKDYFKINTEARNEEEKEHLRNVINEGAEPQNAKPKRRKYKYLYDGEALTTKNINKFFTIERASDREIFADEAQKIENFFHEAIKTEQGRKEIVKVRNEQPNNLPIAFEPDDKGIEYRPVVYHFDKTNKNLVIKRYLKRVGSSKPIYLIDFEALKKYNSKEKAKAKEEEEKLRELYFNYWF